MVLQYIGGRKVAVLIFTILVGLGLVIYKGDIPSNMLSLMVTLVLAYVGGNVGTKLVNKKAETTTESVTTDILKPDLSPQIMSQLDELKASTALTQETLSAFIMKVLKQG